MRRRPCLVLPFIFMSSLSFGTPKNSKKDDNCLGKAINVIDEFIKNSDPKISSCVTKDDCVFSSGGSGAHLNRKYFEYSECFESADKTALRLCDKRSPAEKKNFGGTGGQWVPAKKARVYDCVRKRCTPLYPDDVDLNSPPNRPPVNPEKRSEEISTCIKNIEKALETALK